MNVSDESPHRPFDPPPADIAWRGHAAQRSTNVVEDPVTDRDRVILEEMARHGDARVAFQGLRRRLGLHQQILTRALRRLEADGFVNHGEGGYRLTDSGFDALAGRTLPAATTDVMTLAHALLPPHVAGEELARILAGRWFKGLRWYGRSGGPGETVLAWLTDPGEREVRVRVTSGAVAIEAELEHGDEASDFARAGVLLNAVADVYARNTRGVRAFGAQVGVAG